MQIAGITGAVGGAEDDAEQRQEEVNSGDV